MKTKKKRSVGKGRLRIGDDWNAITIIALSQNNPLKAVAEFVENSIDAGAKNITIVRGKERGSQYIKVIDDGGGLPCTDQGEPDFKYVATHICDSLKKRLKAEGAANIQGEFGIGLLSFWTVGDKLIMLSSGKDGKTYQMEMEKGKPGYRIIQRPRLTALRGTQLTIAPLLSGLRMLAGEKIQRYLASELRDRIRVSGARIKVIDRSGRSEYDVEPRQYSGRLLHGLPAISTDHGEAYVELYLAEKSADNHISLYRSGTRIIPSVSADMEPFNRGPWVSGYFQGIIDVPFLNLTPGTRDGVIRDEKFSAFIESVGPLTEHLVIVAEEQRAAEDERMSKNILRSVRNAFIEAISTLPEEEYDWFDVRDKRSRPGRTQEPEAVHLGENGRAEVISDTEEGGPGGRELKGQRLFFEIAGPLFSAKISPGSAIVEAGKEKTFRAVGYDRSKRQIEEDLSFSWSLEDGAGALSSDDREITVFTAPSEPGLVKIDLCVSQKELSAEASCLVTVVDSLVKPQDPDNKPLLKGLPGYTMESATGQLWRSRYDRSRNIIVINSGHRDFIFAGRQKTRKLRYICRIFAKELVLYNFVGKTPEELLERMVELSLYAEENLK